MPTLSRAKWEDVLVLVGLGNPGPRYAKTRHNFGFMLIDQLARAAGVAVKDQIIPGALTGQGLWGGRRLLLVKPQTYMNRSGQPLRRLLQVRPFTPANLWVVHDDLDLALGTVRIRPGGGSGGHRGVADIAAALGDQGFGRLRLGIGRPQANEAAADYVLSPFTAAEQDLVQRVLDHAVAAARVLLTEGPAAAMARYSGVVG